MYTAVADTVDEQGHNGKEDDNAQMEQRPQSNPATPIIISVVSLLLGIVGGLLTSVATNSEWKGRMEQRMEQVERQRAEDKSDRDYLRAQNEVIGRTLARIEEQLKGKLK